MGKYFLSPDSKYIFAAFGLHFFDIWDLKVLFLHRANKVCVKKNISAGQIVDHNLLSPAFTQPVNVSLETTLKTKHYISWFKFLFVKINIFNEWKIVSTIFSVHHFWKWVFASRCPASYEKKRFIWFRTFFSKKKKLKLRSKNEQKKSKRDWPQQKKTLVVLLPFLFNCHFVKWSEHY